MSNNKGLGGGIGTGTHTVTIRPKGGTKGKVPGKRRDRKKCIFFRNNRCIKKSCECSGPASIWCKWYEE